MSEHFREKNQGKNFQQRTGKQSRRTPKKIDEIKDAFKDEKRLKRHKRRLSLGWFFRHE